MTEELRQDIQRRVQAVQRYYHGGGRAYRTVWVLVAFLTVAAGLAMTVLPGPAVIVVPIGLAMLAVRYRWAQSVLQETIERGVRLQRRFAKARPSTRLAWSLLTLGMTGAAVIAMLR